MTNYDELLNDIESDFQDAQTCYHKTTLGFTRVKQPVSPSSNWGKGDSFIDAGMIKLEELRNVLNVPNEASVINDLASSRLCSECAVNSGDISWASYIICHQWEHKFDSLPGKKIAYRNASFASGSGGLLPNEMQSVWWATIGGKPAASRYFSDLYFADVGHPGYQEAWVQSVIADCRGFDGIALDDVNQDQRFHLGDRQLDKYPTDSSWLAAMESFLTYVGPRLKAAGFLALPNIYIRDFWNEGTKSMYVRWANTCCSGALKEHWTKWDSGEYHTGSGFDHFLDLYRRVQAGKGIFIPTTKAPVTEERAMLYGRAAFLLEYEPNSGSAFIFQPDPEGQPPASPVWMKELGKPLGAKSTTVNGYERKFEKGTVVLDKLNAVATIG